MSMPHPHDHSSVASIWNNVLPRNLKSQTPLSFPWFIGGRYTRSKKKNQLVSFLSAISMSGLVVGVALLIIVLSVMNGFDRDLREKILGLVPQAAIFHVNGIENWTERIKNIEGTTGVVAASPFIRINALASYRKHTSALLVYGIDTRSEEKVSLLSEYLSKETLKRMETEQNTLILGKGLADKLGVSINTSIMLVAPNEKSTSSAPKIAYFQVIDIIHSQTELDQALALTNLRSAAKLKGQRIESESKKSSVVVDGIRLKLDDLFQAANIAYAAKSNLGPGFYQTNWTRTHGNLYYAIQMSKNMVGLLMSLIVAIAAFNVVSTLIMVVVDKQGDIAILRTLGATRMTVLMTFVAQGTFIGVIGICFGVILGCLGALGIEGLVRFVEGALGIQFLQSDVYPLTYLPTEILWPDILRVSLVAMGLSLLATLYPAWKASKVQPAEALRYE